MQRPSGNNADEWNLWLCYWLQGPTQDDAVPSAYLAVQIAEALASARAEGWKAGRDAATKVADAEAQEHDALASSIADKEAPLRVRECGMRAAAHMLADRIRALVYDATAILALEEPHHE